MREDHDGDALTAVRARRASLMQLNNGSSTS
jgi:hypothetical protein